MAAETRAGNVLEEHDSSDCEDEALDPRTMDVDENGSSDSSEDEEEALPRSSELDRKIQKLILEV